MLNYSRYRVLVTATCIGMLLVLLAGALVTKTESGNGCGTDWPLCNGKFIPAYTLQSMIEYSHRFITGIVGLLVLAAFIATLMLYRSHKEPVFYASATGFFTVLQAVLGALAVKYPTSPAVMALHFGFSIMAFAFTLLLVMWTRRLRDGQPIMDKTAQGIPASVYVFALSILVYSYIVIYIGAYVRHTVSSGGCIGWPLCNGDLIPTMEGATRIVFIHRVAAAILWLLILLFFIHVNRVLKGEAHVNMRKTALIVFILVCCQVLSGALLTWTLRNNDWFIFTSILHNLIISGLFGILCDFMIRAWKNARRAV
ncbi:cytochrome c oxidase assembly protein subunit 15 [Paenibacillus taihuensis]|uniref:Cytochrome c oxidase assembly protein subunit 15 n=1 Tax=Paenibacillus taihuensis TaxID=1156355 RepID=A0A3D9SHY2_9BACL|nr:COX15/CtaA family protein [Paenibacillus taihuensis]REE92890.1 cytochrome c oxidase assembly protein subunit 15 [Paenibacillus taihuensis]